MITTSRLNLVVCDKPLLVAILAGNDALKTHLKVDLAENWTEFGEPAFQFSLAKVQDFPEEALWWAYLPILIDENRLIGSCGYKGKVDKNACVEIGYEIAESYRNQGFATELASALIANAFRFEEVKSVIAHTLAEENASVKVLKKCNMKFVAELDDPDEGKVWKWEIKKQDL